MPNCSTSKSPYHTVCYVIFVFFGQSDDLHQSPDSRSQPQCTRVSFMLNRRHWSLSYEIKYQLNVFFKFENGIEQYIYMYTCICNAYHSIWNNISDICNLLLHQCSVVILGMHGQVTRSADDLCVQHWNGSVIQDLRL